MLPRLTELVGLDVPDLGGYLEQRRATPGDLLRVQTLDRYGVPSDDTDFLRYRDGEQEPTSPFREPWFDQLRNDAAAGRVWRNVHVVNLPLSDYLCYQFEWCYAYNVEAGQLVRILDTVSRPEAAAWFRAGDFYVIDGREIVRLLYDADGRYQGAVTTGEPSLAGYAALAEAAWAMSVPFVEWWAAHSEHHRGSRRVA